MTAIRTIEDLSKHLDYSLINSLNCDPDANEYGEEHQPRQVFSGHYVPVKPTPIKEPVYIAHSKSLFQELGFDESFAYSRDFQNIFTGDLSFLSEDFLPYGWATGYALSIYGTEYVHQCPFRTGNGYGDGRAISVLELVTREKRWEFQLKGAGRTPYCRGADGRAVLRSSVREFLAQEHMHALGIRTSRSLSLFASFNETVDRPWYSESSYAHEPDRMVSDPVAITTRVAPSFIRVGQLELFGRRARSQQHPDAMNELEMLVNHLVEREYANEISLDIPIGDKVNSLANAFKDRLCTLVISWLRVGFCQGNFNSDNCACGGFTLDYGPFGFVEQFDPFYQPWTGGGRHFSFLNQTAAAKANFGSFIAAVRPLLMNDEEALLKLESIAEKFESHMLKKMEAMWASKLGLNQLNDALLSDLLHLMMETSVDYNMFFRELSEIPKEITPLINTFYRQVSEELLEKWRQWLSKWLALINTSDNLASISAKMKQVNPKYTWREWLVVPAYQAAYKGEYNLIHELHGVLTDPYGKQCPDIDNQYYQRKPIEFFDKGGVSHYSCSS